MEHGAIGNNTTLPTDLNGTVGSLPAVVDPCALAAYATADMYVKVRLILDVGLVSFLCVFGLSGNVVSFRVLGKMKGGGTTSLLLRSLALADSVYLITCLFFQSGVALNTYVTKFREIFPLFPYAEQYSYTVASMAQTASVWMVVLVTINRWLAICNPLRAKQIGTYRNSVIAIALVAILSIIFNIPTIFEVKVLDVPQPCQNTSRLFVWASDLGLNKYYYLVYKTILCFLVRALIPLAILIFLNVRLVRAIRSSASHGGKITRNHSASQDHLTRLVVGVVTIFVVCALPDLTYRVLLTAKIYSKKSLGVISWADMAYLGVVVNLMLTVNSAINFLVYFVVGKTFRQSLHKVCCCQSGSTWYDNVTITSIKSTAVSSLKGFRPTEPYKFGHKASV